MLERFKVRALSAGSRARVLLATLRGVSDDEQADGEEVLFPHGFASRPAVTDTLWAIATRIGDELLALALRDKGSSGFSPALESAETRIYNLPGATIRLRGDGSIDIAAASGANLNITAAGGANVVVNGGSLDVARATDPVSQGAALALWMSNVTAALNGILGPGAVPAMVGTTIGAIASGAPNFKG